MILVAVSGFGGQTEVAYAYDAGFNQYSFKPVSYQSPMDVVAGLRPTEVKLVPP